MESTLPMSTDLWAFVTYHLSVSLFSLLSKVTECQLVLSDCWSAAELFPKLCLFYEKQCVVDISLLKGILSWISIVNRFTRINSIEGCILYDCRAEGAPSVAGDGARPPDSRPDIDGVWWRQPIRDRAGADRRWWLEWRHPTLSARQWEGWPSLSCLPVISTLLNVETNNRWSPTPPPGERDDALPPVSCSICLLAAASYGFHGENTGIKAPCRDENQACLAQP